MCIRDSCYAHQLNLTTLQASFSIPKVRLVFMNNGGFPAFFNRSQRIKVLESVLDQCQIPMNQAQDRTSTADLC